ISCFPIPRSDTKGYLHTTFSGCRDSKGELHEFDSHWRTNDCHDCSFQSSTGYDEEKCISIFNKETCTYKVVEKDDHSKECPVHTWVG
uniref:Beta-microseminoprotein n=1 Tax=Aquila chrysaetos chrysaetos TaxID=223781 RepID=A0A663EPX1_AQUCH